MEGIKPPFPLALHTHRNKIKERALRNSTLKTTNTQKKNPPPLSMTKLRCYIPSTYTSNGYMK